MRNIETFKELVDLIPEGTIPLYGMRLVVTTGPDERSMQICSHGGPDVETLLGAMCVAQEIMMENFLSDE